MAEGDEISLDVDRFAKVVASLAESADRLQPTMQVAAEMLVSEVHDRWMSAGDGTWDPLAESTLAKRRGTTAQILVDTGRALASVHGESGGDFAEASTDVDYMRFHVGDQPRSVIPQRDPFDLGDEATDRVTDFILADYVVRWADGR